MELHWIILSQLIPVIDSMYVVYVVYVMLKSEVWFIIHNAMSMYSIFSTMRLLSLIFPNHLQHFHKIWQFSWLQNWIVSQMNVIQCTFQYHIVIILLFCNQKEMFVNIYLNNNKIECVWFKGIRERPISIYIYITNIAYLETSNQRILIWKRFFYENKKARNGYWNYLDVWHGHQCIHG